MHNTTLLNARLRKSNALLILLVRSRINAELAQLMTESEWKDVARAARVIPPSVETRRIVLDQMRQMETPLSCGGVQ